MQKIEGNIDRAKHEAAAFLKSLTGNPLEWKKLHPETLRDCIAGIKRFSDTAWNQPPRSDQLQMKDFDLERLQRKLHWPERPQRYENSPILNYVNAVKYRNPCMLSVRAKSYLVSIDNKPVSVAEADVRFVGEEPRLVHEVSFVRWGDNYILYHEFRQKQLSSPSPEKVLAERHCESSVDRLSGVRLSLGGLTDQLEGSAAIRVFGEFVIAPMERAMVQLARTPKKV